jgi:hypothetical protein
VRYLLLLRGDETAAAQAGPEMARRCHEWAAAAERRGVRQAGTGLRPPASAKTVRVRDGEVLLTDGPFAETKEQIGGYNILECADHATAVEVASRHPWAEAGTLELREIPDAPRP